VRATAPLVYLAHPIDQNTAEIGVNLVSGELIRSGYLVYDPATAFHGAGVFSPAPYVNRINRAAMRAASAMVALWPRGVVSVGVPIEIDWACRRGLPLVLLSTDNWLGDSWAADRWVNRAFFQDANLDGLGEALEYLQRKLPTSPAKPADDLVFAACPGKVRVMHHGIGRHVEYPCELALGHEGSHWNDIQDPVKLSKAGACDASFRVEEHEPGWTGDDYRGCYLRCTRPKSHLHSETPEFRRHGSITHSALGVKA
jgi:hypothetical protein